MPYSTSRQVARALEDLRAAQAEAEQLVGQLNASEGSSELEVKLRSIEGMATTAREMARCALVVPPSHIDAGLVSLVELDALRADLEEIAAMILDAIERADHPFLYAWLRVSEYWSRGEDRWIDDARRQTLGMVAAQCRKALRSPEAEALGEVAERLLRTISAARTT